MKKIPIFPQDFYDFRDAEEVDDKEINKWIKEGLQYMMKDKKRNFSSTHSGNTRVIISRNLDGISISVSKHHLDWDETLNE